MHMRDVEIVYAHNPDTDGPDLDRIGTVVTLNRADARSLVNSGEARYTDIPRDDAGRDLADMPRQVVAAHAKAAGVDVTADMSKTQVLDRIRQANEEQQMDKAREDLSKLTKDELRDRFPAAADMPATAKKDELVAAAEDALRADGSGEDAEGDGEQATDADTDNAAGTPIVTVMPGAGHSAAVGDDGPNANPQP
jgi:hypothetical protein